MKYYVTSIVYSKTFDDDLRLFKTLFDGIEINSNEDRLMILKMGNDVVDKHLCSLNIPLFYSNVITWQQNQFGAWIPVYKE